MKKKLNIVVLVLVSYNCSFAQDYNFQPFQLTPLYYNPAFAGSLGKSRVNLFYQFETGNYKNKVNHSFLSYDQLVDAFRGGIGIKARYSTETESRKNFQTDICYSPKFKMKDVLTIAPAIEVSFIDKEFTFLYPADPFYEDITMKMLHHLVMFLTLMIMHEKTEKQLIFLREY